MEKLTALIPVGNEIHNIKEVINSVNFADEILVVDSYSNDGTYEVAEKYATKVIRREYQYSSSQKNWSIPQAKYSWVLIVDADERVTPELKEEIQEILKNPNEEYNAYSIVRNNHFMGKKVYYSGWRNDKVIRLFKKDYCKYEDKYVHAKLLVNGKVSKLTNKLYHNTSRSMDVYIEKLNRYASLQAKDYEKHTSKLTPYHFVIKPAWTFFKHYIIQSGFRDGFIGLTISYLRGYSVYMRYLKLWLIRKKK